MRRKIWFGSAVLLAIAAVEFGLLGAGAAGITGRHDAQVDPGIVAATATPASPPTPTSPCLPSSPPCSPIQTSNTYAIDADPNTPDIQDTIRVPVGSTFTFDTVITAAPDAYLAEQVNVAFDPNVIAYTSGPVNNPLGKAVVCVPGAIDPNHVYAGCLQAVSAENDTGITFEWTMKCLVDGSTALHFLTIADIGLPVGTEFTLVDLSIATPVLHDATVNCGTGTPGPATATRTPTSTPVSTATSSPTATPCSAASPPCEPTIPPGCPPSPPQQVSPPSISPPPAGCGEPFSIEISANPLEIACNGFDATKIVVHVRDQSGANVPDGTPVFFENPWGTIDFASTRTFGGIAVAVAHAGPVPYASLTSFTVSIEVGRLQSSFRVLCTPGPISPPPCESVSPPSMSPPCATPTPVPCLPAGVPNPGGASPPCGPISPPPCEPVSPPSMSPPCAPPTPVPCLPAGVPNPGGASPPCATPTAVPTSTNTPAPEVCADVTGDGRVTVADLMREEAMTRHKNAPSKYDLNGDGRVDQRDVAIVISQLGRRCER